MRIFRFDEIDSTNIFLKNKKDLEDGDCVIAKTQTAGVGRRGNTWVSNEGMAIFSFAIKETTELSLEDCMKFPLLSGIAVLKGLQKVENLKYKFKWTNDVYVNDKKISGILIEKIREFYIIGIGINANNEDFGYASDRAISLKQITKKEYDLEDLIFIVIEEFKKYLEKLKDGKWENILTEINSYNYLYGKEITIEKYGEIIGSGIALNIADDGRLEVEIEGEKRLFNIGEIHIKK